MIACLAAAPPEATALQTLRLGLDGLSPRVHLEWTADRLAALIDLGRGTVADARRHIAVLRGIAAAARLSVALGVAPAPTLARLAARCAGSDAALVVSPAAVPALLAVCPVEWLEPLAPLAPTLRGLGLDSLGAVAALPEAAFGARFGSALLPVWRALHGREAPLLPVPPPPRLRLRHAFAAPVADRAVLDRTLARMTAALGAGLERRGEQARSLALHLSGDDGAWSAGRALERPAASPGALLSIATRLLEDAEIAGPVLEMALLAGELVPLRGEQASLFAPVAACQAAGRAALADLARRLPPGGLLYAVGSAICLALPEARHRLRPWDEE
ncbi:MAG: hypothetical protein RMK84_15230 [Oscillochloridaceae bacterium]|nr:hypothetical protein [Chloroflexaceae bacterium]MDW8391476.1 hypothetical protein [Oscillochloridaceae bacterium]